MSLLLSKATTAWRLGIPNIIRFLCYRMGVLSGLNPVKKLQQDVPKGPFYLPVVLASNPLLKARSGWFDHAEAFGISLGPLDESPPNWFANFLTSGSFQGADRNWWEIPDFDPQTGDIKTVWEFSRFDWLIACAQQHVAGNTKACGRLESWLQNWCDLNPPYKGPNWKCGQEASIRVMHLATALLLMQQTKSTVGLLDLFRVHLQRIAPTMQYAIAQDNNHGTSEAAALFIGGSFLLENGDAHGKRWMNTGRKWLENRAARLIAEDGSFSQHSLNYHRVVLDTYSLVEIWRKHLSLKSFTPRLYQRCRAATLWLFAVIDPESGDGPNLGANDGARLLPLTDNDFRDYRPSVQLASAVFLKSSAFPEEGKWNQPLYWLGLKVPSVILQDPRSRQFDDGGYAVLRHDKVMALLRYPRYRFRPSQCDALHLDLWIGKMNWLRDAGTFGYNADSTWQKYFPGTGAHNTVQFDDDEQMPRLGRFLYGDWLRTDTIEPFQIDDKLKSFGASYRDKHRRQHNRKIALNPHKLVVTDEVSGFSRKAVLRWRLKPEQWVLNVEEQKISCTEFSIQIISSVPILRMGLCEGWESRHYLQKTIVPVLEVEIGQAGTLVSSIEWREN